MENKTAAEYLIHIDEIVSQLKEAGKEVDSGLVVISTLDGLSEVYSTFVAIANQRSPAYTYEQLKIALLSEEDRLNQEGNVENVMAVNKYQKIYCHICGKNGSHYPSQCHNKRRYNNRYSQQNHRFSEKYCTYHKSRGHNTSECKTMQARQESNQVEDESFKGYH